MKWIAVIALAACGGGGSSSGDGGADGSQSGSMARTLATMEGNPRDVAIDDGYVYFTNYVDPPNGTVKRVPKAGGTAEVLASGLDRPRRITLDDTYAYFTVEGSGLGDGKVMRVPKAGGTPEVIALGLDFARGIAVDATTVYFTTTDSIGTVNAVPKGGGSVVSFGGGTDGGSTWPWDGLAIDSSSVYWLAEDSGSQGKVYKATLNGGSVTFLADGMSQVVTITTDATDVYWTASGGVYKVAKGGGSVTTLASGQLGAWGLTLDDQFVYWGTNNGQPHVRKVPKAGGATVDIVDVNHPVDGIAVDANAIYWAGESVDTDGNGVIATIAK